MKTKEITYQIDNSINKVVISDNIEKKLLKDLTLLKSDKKALFIYDENIDKKFITEILGKIKLSGCRLIIQKIQGDKKNKTLKNLLKLFDILLKNKFSKKSVIISCGGGVIGDMCGLLSSLYLRGTYYFHIPSTMTAIVDSCIGGKTAINYKGIINSMGNYYHPNRVYISFKILKNLPNREYYSGFSEILKCGLIKKNNILGILLKDNQKIVNREFNTLSKLILESLKTKISFFINDIKENNKRLFLNFGHTFAHAIEMATDKCIKKDFLRHGEAVGVGMLCEILLSNNNINKKTELIKICENLLKKYNLPILINLPYKVSLQNFQNEVYKNIFLDKKRVNKNPRYIFLKKIGKPKIREIENLNALNDVIYRFIN